jgi:acyl-CoA thioesterase
VNKRKTPSTIPDVPLNALLGIEVIRFHKDGLSVRCRVRPELRNSHGVLHGGVTATLVDVAVGLATVHHFAGRRMATTVEMKVNYFLPITEGMVTARAKLLRVGTSLVVGSVEVKDHKRRLAAFGTATYKLLG